jgi:uncharacterized protein
MKHIDTHIHLYPEKLMEAIYRYFERLNWNLPHRYNVSGALDYLKQADAEKAFVLLYAHKANMSRELNKWAHQLCRQHPHLIPFASYFPDDDHREALVKTCLRDWDFAGFKLHFNVQPYRPDDPRYFPVYRGVLEYGKGLIMHIGRFPQNGNHAGADMLHAVLQRYPELKIIVAHLGLYQTEEFWRLMDRYPGVYLDTAFVLGNPDYHDSSGMVQQTLERFPHRVVYGSDFPLIRFRLEDGLDYIQKLPWPEEMKENLLYSNALRFLES